MIAGCLSKSRGSLSKLRTGRRWPILFFVACIATGPFSSSIASAAQSGCQTASAFFGRLVLKPTSANTYVIRDLEFTGQLSLTFVKGEGSYAAVVCKAGDCARLPFTKVFIPEPDQVFHNEDFRWVYFQIYFVSDSESSVVNFKQLTDELIVEDLNWGRAELFCK